MNKHPAQTETTPFAAQLQEAHAMIAHSPTEAADALARLAADALGAGDHTTAAMAARMRARALAYLGDYEASLSSARHGGVIANAAGLGEECARARLAAMHALVESGRLDEAEAEGLQAREHLERLGKPELVARADINLGILHQRQGRLREARERFDAAAPALLAEPLVLAQLENNRAEVLLRLYDFQGARLSFESSLSSNRAAGATVNAAIALGNLADLEARRGEFGPSLRTFEEAINALIGAGSDTHVLRLRAERAEVMDAVGLHDQARAELQDTLEHLDRAGMRREAARARAALGRSWRAIGSTAAAQTHLLAAQSQFESLGDAMDSARTALELACLAEESGDHAQAEMLARRALSSGASGSVDRARAHLTLASCALSRGATAEASALADMALACAVDVAPLTAAAHLMSARVARATGAVDRALALALRAADTLDRLRTDLPARRFRLAYATSSEARRQVLALQLTQATVSAAHVACAMDAVDAREQADEQALAVEDMPADTEHARRAALLADLNALYSLIADATANDVRHDDWRERVAEVEESLDALESTIETRGAKAHHPAMRRAVAAEPLRTATMQGVVIRFGTSEGHVVAAVVGSGADTILEICSVAEADRLIRALLFQMRGAVSSGSTAFPSGDPCRRILRQLESTLLSPLRGLEAHACAIVPTGPLALLPPLAFESIRSRAGRLVVAESTAAAAGALALRTASLPAASTLQVAVIDHDDGSLAGARAECDAVAASWLAAGAAVQRLTGAEATVEAAARAMRGVDVVHLACHGWFSPTIEGASGLKLADGWLTRQVMRRERLCARVVVLSGCETGPGSVDSLSRSTSGLFSAFLAAGAQSVVATLWPVRDDLCAFSMDLLHRLWQNGSAVSLADSLTQVADAVRERSPHPCHWAPLTLFEKGSS